MIAHPEQEPSQKLVSELAECLGSTMSGAGARSILEFRLDGPTPQRRAELASKANEGLLTAAELAEYHTYAQLRGLLALLQSKARLRLRGPAPA